MKKLLVTAVVATLLTAASVPGATLTPMADIAPTVEVTFVLDTTQSMSRLIEGAKQKIWTIARQMVSGRPAPSIKLGLIGFRDRGDQYVTQYFDLTSDIDALYGHLSEFKAAGGGDKPESVNQALYEAVTKPAWSKDANSLKIIFLVGDAPPHMDYPDDVKYPEVIQLARRAGIIINTIQCGADAQTTGIWKEIAAAADGAYVQIAQSGGMSAISTPIDAELSRITGELTKTVVPYGDAARQSEVRSKTAAAGRADVERLVFLNIDRAEFGAKVVVTGEGELIWDVVNRKVKIEDIPEADFPVSLQKMSREERTSFIEEQFTKRKELQIKVDELSKERDVHVKAAMEKLVLAGGGDSFDAKVAEMIQAQALKRGIKYDISIPAPAKR